MTELRIAAVGRFFGTALLLVHRDGRVVDAVPSVATLLGTASRADLLGKAVADLLPSDRSTLEEFLAMCRRSSDPLPGALSVQRPDGSLLSLRLWGARVDGDHVLLRLESKDRENRFVTLNRDLERAHREIARRRLLEERLREAQDQVVRAQKLESLGLLAGGVAHDFNNLLLTITANAEMVLRRTRVDPQAQEHVKEILQASRRAAELCIHMLTYAGKGNFVMEPVDPAKLIHEMRVLMEPVISKRVQVALEADDDLPAVVVDETQMRQVVMNLILNGSEAIEEATAGRLDQTGAEEGGEVRIRVRFRQFDRSAIRQWMRKAVVPDVKSPALGPGDYVVIDVEDDGGGIPADQVHRIFDPFYSTKESGHGLGLTAVLGFVRSHEGGLSLDTEPGRGTGIQIVLPASERETRDPGRPSRPTEALRGEGTLLVVDDEDSVRVAISRVLEDLGFDVLTASDGREAIDVFRERHHDIRLVLLDMTMPRMNGERSFAAMREIDPSVVAVLSSGYNEQAAVRRLLEAGIAEFLPKPYDRDALVSVVQAALARKREQTADAR